MRLRLTQQDLDAVAELVTGDGQRSDILAALTVVGLRYPQELRVVRCAEGAYEWTRLLKTCRSDIAAHKPADRSIGDVVAAAVRVGLRHLDQAALPTTSTHQEHLMQAS